MSSRPRLRSFDANARGGIMLLVIGIAASLLAILGCGALTAARIVGEGAGAGRFRSKPAYAVWNGTAPQPVWSGNSGRLEQANTSKEALPLLRRRLADLLYRTLLA